MKPVRVGLLGIGTVGGGTFQVLSRNREEITRRAGRPIEIVTVADKDLVRAREVTGGKIMITDDAFAVVNDPDIDVIVELIGGCTIARDLVLKALQNGKHVVTANKALLATHGNAIFAAARTRGVMVGFEAAVAGGIPIIKVMRESLTANRIEWLAGIINGTCNFILTEMRNHGREFKAALADAQKRGYAEADPTFDIEGVDAAHKLTILASLAFGNPLQIDKVHVEGITNVASEDVAYAGMLGYRVKLLGIARRTAEGIEMRVHPALIPETRLIANVDGVMNAVLVRGDAVGPLLFYGAGAGAQPTASSVVADLVDVARSMSARPEHRVPHLAFQPDAVAEVPILAMDQIESAYYLRITALDRPGVLADISRILADRNISIEAIQQPEPVEGQRHVPVIILTQRVIEHSINEAIKHMESLQSVQGHIVRLRVETLA